MPIKGMSERIRIPQAGKIRLGIRDPQRGNAPREVDYFILDPQTGNAQYDADLAARFKRIYGEEPKAIRAMFPPAPIDDVFPQWFKRYGSKGKASIMQCRGDGEVAWALHEKYTEGLEKLPSFGEREAQIGMVKVACAGNACPYAIAKKCHPVGQLRVILPEVEFTQTWQISTGSWHSMVNINSAIKWLQALCGRHFLIPFTLVREPKEIHDAEGGTSRTHYVLNVDKSSIQSSELSKALQVDPTKMLLLPMDETPEIEDRVPAKTYQLKQPEALPPPAAAPVPVEEKGPLAHRPKTKWYDLLEKQRTRLGKEAFDRVLGECGASSMELASEVQTEATRVLNACLKVKP